LALARLSALVAGVCAPWTIVCLLFAFTGGLGALLDQVVVANLVRYPADPPTAIRASIAGDISALWGFWLILGALLLVGVMRWAGIPRSWRHTPGLAVWVTVLIGALNLVPFASHAYPHYFLQLLPWAALLVALAFLPALDAWRAAVRRTAPTVEAIPARALLASVALAGLLLLLSPPAQLPPTQWQADATEAQSQANVGTWIASYTPPNARLLIAPTDPSYYFLARRTPAVPYVYLLPINLSPSLLTSATEQVRTRQFDVVVWQLGGVIGGQAPQFATLYQALLTHYHLAARNTRLNIAIYLPNVLG
jgi:hypothetical protein